MPFYNLVRISDWFALDETTRSWANAVLWSRQDCHADHISNADNLQTQSWRRCRYRARAVETTPGSPGARPPLPAAREAAGWR